MQKTHEHPIRQGADLLREIFILKTSWRFDHVTNTRSRDSLKNFYLHFHKIYRH